MRYVHLRTYTSTGTIAVDRVCRYKIHVFQTAQVDWLSRNPSRPNIQRLCL